MHQGELRWQKNPWQARLLLALQKRRSLTPLRIFWATILNIDCGNLPRSIILPHPYNVVVHGHTPIGVDCVIYHGVTVGADGAGGVPRLGDRVVVFAGACILGDVEIGDDAVIGANSVVLKSVPAGATAVGVPARTVSM